jgi:hypothetical protein
MYAMLSHVCESMGVRPVNGPDVTRDAFTATCIAKARPTPGHTHPDAAAFRTAATETALNVSSYAGSSIFVIGLSRTDQRRALRGTRAWYWAKDTHTRNQSDNPSSDDFLYICDVDYYIDMPDLLAKNCHPTLIYTVVPEHAATDGVDDTSFHFDENGVLHSHVAGSGHYEHNLWDYGVDSVMVTNRFFGIPISATVYAVERKQVTRNRQLILLAPIIRFPGTLSAFLLSGCCRPQNYESLILSQRWLMDLVTLGSTCIGELACASQPRVSIATHALLLALSLMIILLVLTALVRRR